MADQLRNAGNANNANNADNANNAGKFLTKVLPFKVPGD